MELDPGKHSQNIITKSIDLYIQRQALPPPGTRTMPDLECLTEGKVTHFPAYFETSLVNGLSSEQVGINREKYGSNAQTRRQSKSFKQIFHESLCQDMLIILVITVGISVLVGFLFGHDRFWVEGVSILCVLALTVLITALAKYRRQRQLRKLSSTIEDMYKYAVLRDGCRRDLCRKDIVAGDMIIIEGGLEIPTDCVLLRGSNVIVDENLITGSIHQIYKQTFDKCLAQGLQKDCPSPIMIGGSSVISGEGIMMAVVVGEESRLGKHFSIRSTGESEEQNTLIGAKVQVVGKRLGYFGLYSAVVMFMALVGRLVFQDVPRDDFSVKKSIGDVIDYLIISITIIVISVPEILPLGLSLISATAIKRMHEDKILVNTMRSCQILAATTYICTDKTAALTQNKMYVVKIVNDHDIEERDFVAEKLHPKYIQILSEAIFHNSLALQSPQKGSQTQIALLKIATKISGKRQTEVRKEFEREGYYLRLPFNSSRKRMTTGVHHGAGNFIFTTGASQQILNACKHIYNCYSNETKKLSHSQRQQILQKMVEMGKLGLRMVGVAFKVDSVLGPNGSKISSRLMKTVNSSYYSDDLQEIQTNDFILLGIFGLEDSVRSQSSQAVQKCKRGDVKVVMVTGDSEITAKNVAEQAGIYDPQNDRILNGTNFINELDANGLLVEEREKGEISGIVKVKLSNDADIEKFRDMIEDVTVITRSKPEHKYLFIDGLRKIGQIVGATGDESNDSNALQIADVGFAMGNISSQVAKNSCDIVILDDHFDSMVKAIGWSRSISWSVRKFVQFQLTINIVTIGFSLLTAALIRQPALTPVQILWVNVILGSLGKIALTTDYLNQKSIFRKQPSSLDEPLITKIMIKHIIGQSIFQLLVLSFLCFYGYRFLPESSDSYDSLLGGDLDGKYWNGQPEGTMVDGKFYTLSGREAYINYFNVYNVYSRHFTFMFNTFVFMQIFNLYLSRKVEDQFLVCGNFCRNYRFWIFFFIICGLQFVVIEYGGQFFQLYSFGGLDLIQWMASVGIGAMVFLWGILLRFIPISNE